MLIEAIIMVDGLILPSKETAMPTMRQLLPEIVKTYEELIYG